MIEHGKTKGETGNMGQGRELDRFIARTRDVQRFHPRLAFRIKVALVSRFPDSAALRRALGTPGGKPAESGHGPPAWKVVLRPAAAALVAASVVFILLVGLTMMAGSSQPGDTLYAFKHARESIEMSFTRDPVPKAKKRLSLAEKRLSELEHFLSAGTLEPENIEYIANEYNKNKEYVEEVISSNAGKTEASRLQAHLDFIENQKDNLVNGMISGAGAEEVMFPAVGARVTVSDRSGRSSLGRVATDVSGRTDKNGEFEFEFVTDEPGDTRQVEAVIKLDGRKNVVPLYDAGDEPSYDKEAEAVSAEVTPLPDGGKKAILDNGVVLVSTDGLGSGTVIDVLSAVDNGGTVAGPLEVTLVGQDGTPVNGDTVLTKGPYIIPTAGSSAAYELQYDLELEGSTVHSVFRVSLAEGDSYVSVSCKTSVEGIGTRLSAAGLQMRLPLGADTRIGGEPVKSSGNGEPITVAFDDAHPYATFDSGGETISLVFPENGPEEWSVSGNLLLSDFASENLSPAAVTESTALLGFCDEGESALLVEVPGDSSLSTPATVNENGDGFHVECSPLLEELKPGRHTITLTVRKQYETIGDFFE